MSGSNLRMKLASQKYDKNINIRGKVPKSMKESEVTSPVGPWLLALFIFVVCGSAVFEIIRSVQQA